MQFSGYLITDKDIYITLDHYTFDETELTPESNWKEAWQNIDSDAGVWGYVEIQAAIRQAAKLIAEINKIKLTDIEIDTLLNDNVEKLPVSELSTNLIALSTGYKLSTLDDVKVINAALNSKS
jgi:hypothetical protein